MASKDNSKATKQASSNSDGKPRKPRMSKRDFTRMQNKNDAKSQSSGIWADLVEVEQKNDKARLEQMKKKAPAGSAKPTGSASNTNSSVRGQHGDMRRQKWEPTDQARLSTTETPPRDEPICPGVFTGSIQISSRGSQNLDFSGFDVMVREIYDVMLKNDKYIQRSCPFPLFQHYCTTILNARILDYQRLHCKHDMLRTFPSYQILLGLDDIILPHPLKEFLDNIGNMLTPDGEPVGWNLPAIAIPQGAFTDDEGNIIPSGSFGQINALNHNVYECYISPMITQGYIVASAANQGQNAEEQWLPFPENWIPDDARATPNILGYWPINTRLHSEGIAKLNRCEFVNDLSPLGRLSYCPYVMTSVGDYLKSQDKLRLSRCVFKEKENASIFVIKRMDNGEYTSDLCLAGELANVYSPFSFGADNGNKAQYFGLKRERTEEAPGLGVVDADGEALPGWIETMNANFLMQQPFDPRPRHDDRTGLRLRIHEENGMVGPVSGPLHEWLSLNVLK